MNRMKKRNTFCNTFQPTFFRGFCCISAFILIVASSCTEKSEKAELFPTDYDTWDRVNKKELDYPIPGHESRYRIIYINEKGKEVQITQENASSSYSFPEGTIIVKETYSDLEPQEGEEPVQLTVMIKEPENEKARGGWLWIMKDLEKEDTTIVTHEFCITCHANANQQHPYGDQNVEEEFRDYVFFASDVPTE